MYACQTIIEFQKKSRERNYLQEQYNAIQKKETQTHTFTKHANEMNVSRSFITDQRKQTDILNNKQ